MLREDYYGIMHSELFAQGPVVVFIWRNDAQWSVDAVSGNVKRILGYTCEDFVEGRAVYAKLVHPDDLARVTQEVIEHGGKTSRTFEHAPYRLLHGDGEYRWIKDTTVIVRGESGAITHYVGYIIDNTQEEETQYRLVESTQRLNEAQRIAKVGSWSLDLVHNHLEWSDEIFRIFEIDATKFLPTYEGFLHAIHPDDVNKVNDAFDTSIKAHKPYHIEHRLLMADGRIKYVIENGRTSYDEASNAIFTQGTIQDVTQSTRLQQELAIHNRELETILSTTKDGIAIIDLEGKFLYVNAAYRSMVGYSTQELLSMSCTHLEPVTHAPKDTLLRQEVLSKRSIENVEKSYRTKTGERIYVNLSIALMPDEGRMLLATKDITQAKRLEREMKEYMGLVDEYINTSSTDLEGTITAVSKAFCRMSKYTPEELIGHNHRIVRHPDMAPEIYETMWRHLTNNETWEGEMMNLAKDDTAYWVHAIISPIYDDEGRKTGYTSIRQDITNRKRVEELSITDRLTGLYNRLKLDEVFAYELTQAHRYTVPLSIILLDIDHFKSVNDTHGHQIGDTVLKQLALILRNGGRESDTVGRWGGEEFLIIMPQTDIKGAKLRAEKLRLAVQAFDFGIVGRVTVSLGIAQYVHDDTEHALIERADRALYAAKAGGRNRVKGD